MIMETNKPILSAQEQAEEEKIQAAFQHLIDTYLATKHRRKVDIITKAFHFAKQAHKGVRRLSGEPYILHPIAVAQVICEEIGMGSTSICAALLHDVVEDTDYTYEDISNLFGPKVANIVEGVTKINNDVFGDCASAQAETFKKLLLTMSDDIRVILVKIADRVHNIRTLSSMLPSKQYKIAGETMYIYAPLADRLGLNKIKTELENLSFSYEHPEEYQNVMDKLTSSQPERDRAFEKFTPAITAALDEMGVRYTIQSRIKSPYSIWQKMQNKNIPFEEVYDILAIRIVFTPQHRTEEVSEAFQIYSALTKIYKPHPTRFRDWLSNPKANGYQALHNTFMSREGKWIEVQIRSDRMDDIAEQGFAAHWKYKDKGAPYDESELDKWLNSIKEILDDPQPDTLDLLDTIKLNLYAKDIFVFTPKGEIRTMPLNSTVLDFAFSIHSSLGLHCFGAKVNHKLVPLSYRLKSGDQVEILTSASQHIRPEWLELATTAKARTKIQAVLRREARDKQRKGEEKLRTFLSKKGFSLTTADTDKLVRYHSLSSREMFYQLIGEDKYTPSELDVAVLSGKRIGKKSRWWRFLPFFGKKEGANEVSENTALALDFRSMNRKKTFVLNDEVLPHCTMAACCTPLPGDDSIGYITPTGGLEIHRRNCATASRLKSQQGNDILATAWDTHKQHLYRTQIRLRGMDGTGVLYAIADVLHKLHRYPIHGVELTTQDGIFEGTLSLSVYDIDDLRVLCTQLSEIEQVQEATRVFKA